MKRRKKKGATVEESAPPPPPPDVELEAALAVARRPGRVARRRRAPLLHGADPRGEALPRAPPRAAGPGVDDVRDGPPPPGERHRASARGGAPGAPDRRRPGEVRPRGIDPRGCGAGARERPAPPGVGTREDGRAGRGREGGGEGRCEGAAKPAAAGRRREPDGRGRGRADEPPRLALPARALLPRPALPPVPRRHPDRHRPSDRPRADGETPPSSSRRSPSWRA